jgi:hypothetical protein
LVSRDWFDPFGIRGSRLDPFVIFTNALTGQGPAGQSAEFLATTIARRVVGRTVQIDGTMTIVATIEAVDEARPPAPIAALPTGIAEVPMWERVRIRLQSIRLGDWHVEHAALDASDIRLVGVTSQSMKVGATEFVAKVRSEEVVRWAGAVSGDHRVRVHDGRLEVTDRRLERWLWIEVGVHAVDQTIVVTPRTVRALGRAVPLPLWLRRAIERPAEWLPAAVRVERSEVVEGDVVVHGSLSTSVVPVDMARLLADLGAEGTMTALRIATGDW